MEVTSDEWRPTWTRKQYLDGECNHRQYYGQFVEPYMFNKLNACFKKRELLAGSFDDFSKLDGTRFGFLGKAPKALSEKIRLCGDYPTAAGMTCLGKEVARQQVEIWEAMPNLVLPAVRKAPPPTPPEDGVWDVESDYQSMPSATQFLSLNSELGASQLFETTVIVTDTGPKGYNHPIILMVMLPQEATDAEIQAAVVEEYRLATGEVRDSLRLEFAFAGDLDIARDWREDQE